MPSDVLKGKRCVVPAKLSNSIYVEKGSERPLPFSLILAGILYRDERAGYLLKIIFVLSYNPDSDSYVEKSASDGGRCVARPARSIIRKSKCSTDFKRNDFLKKNEAYPLGALRSLKFAYRKLRISLFVELAV